MKLNNSQGIVQQKHSPMMIQHDDWAMLQKMLRLPSYFLDQHHLFAGQVSKTKFQKSRRFRGKWAVKAKVKIIGFHFSVRTLSRDKSINFIPKNLPLSGIFTFFSFFFFHDVGSLFIENWVTRTHCAKFSEYLSGSERTHPS